MSTDRKPDGREERILILAPSRRDAPTVAAILEQAGMITRICGSASELCAAMGEDAGAALIAEEAISASENAAVVRACLERQPPWSEPPIVLVAANGSRIAAVGNRGLEPFTAFGNVVLLERPLRSMTLVSAMRTALRARRRQYQVRDYLRERERTEERLRAQEQELRRLNEGLEQRVRERTAELEASHRKLAEEVEQRQQTERALRQAQKMEAVGQLTGGIAHDFNNLLMVVSGGVEMLERTSDPARRERIMSGMRQAATRGEALTRQLLAFSRRMALSPQPVDLRAQLEGMQVLLAGALRENIGLEIRLPEKLWPVMADPTQLELALLNAAVNARDAMPEGGAFMLEASNVRLTGVGESGLRGEFVRIEIRDTGAGIDPDILDRVFEPFFTTKPVGKGTGLGLSQVYGFAKQSGGHAKVRSRLREGTSIIIHLPRAEIDIPKESPQASTAGAPALSMDGRRSVLLVEDNDQVALLTTEMLEGLGFAVSRVASAPAALAKLEDGYAPDLVFSDIVMPGGMNGVELAHELKRSRPELPIILATGYSDAALDRETSEELMILRKPYRLETLQAALQTLCSP